MCHFMTLTAFPNSTAEEESSRSSDTLHKKTIVFVTEQMYLTNKHKFCSKRIFGTILTVPLNVDMTFLPFVKNGLGEIPLESRTGG
jgi:hypothetical protein